MGGTARDGSVRSKARQLYDAYKQDPDAVDGNVIGSVIALVASEGDNDLYDEFYTRFKGAKTPEDEGRFLYALAGFHNLELLQKTLESALDPAKIRTQDAPFVVARVMQNETGGEHAWKFVKDNWDKLVTLYPESGVVRMCGGVTALSTPELEADVIEFFRTHPVKTGEKAIPQYLELLRVAVLLRQREAGPLEELFAPVLVELPATDTSDGAGAADLQGPDGAVRPPQPEDASSGNA